MQTSSLPPHDVMVRAMLASDRAYEGVFYTAVRTTGIFCRPSCRARKPLPENVLFFKTAEDALASGFRPCLRCKPLDASGAAPEWVAKALAAADALPNRAREAAMLLYSRVLTPLGPMMAMAEAKGLVLLEFADRPALPKEIVELRSRYGYIPAPGWNEHLQTIERELAAFFEGRLQSFTVPLVTPGAEFKKRIWQELRAIPYGTTATYGEIAKRLGSPGASRAVGLANGQNRLAVVIPCHRVIGADGSLTGYGGGQPRKAFLLELERRFGPGLGQQELF